MYSFLNRKKNRKHVVAFRKCFGKLAILRSFFKEGNKEIINGHYVFVIITGLCMKYGVLINSVSY